MTDIIHAVAIMCGSIIKIELSQSNIDQNWLVFEI